MKHIVSENDYVVCKECNKQFKKINNRHLLTHKITFEDYLIKYPNSTTITKNEYIKIEQRSKLMREKKKDIVNEIKVINCFYCKKEFEANINQSTNFSICKTCKKEGKKSPFITKKVIEKRGINPSNKKEVIEKKKENLKKKIEFDPEYYNNIVAKREKTLKENFGEDFYKELNILSRKALKEKSGFEYALQNSESLKKQQETMLEKTGFISTFNDKEKIKDSVNKKYNVDNVMKLDWVKEKVIKTNLEKLGVEYPTQNEIVKNKIKETNILRYGVDHILKLDKYKRNISDKLTGRISPLKNKTLEEIHGKEKASQIKEKFNKIYIKRFLPSFYKTLDFLDLEFIDPEYLGAHKKHNFKCKKCSLVINQIWNEIQQGYLCPKCYPRNQGYSKGEKEVLSYIKSLLPDKEIIENDTTILDGQELDIFIPEYNIAIEYNGNYFHSDIFKNRMYHFNKTTNCLKNNIKLITIFEDEWIIKQNIVKERVRYILKMSNSIKVNARDCIIKEIDSKVKNDFLENYHIQGKDNSSIKLGAFYKDELISIMTFSHGNISKGSSPTKDIWELNRFCNNYKYRIPGIAGKLLNYFKNNFEWKQIFSYADRRWSQGNVYYKLGFSLKGISLNYWYSKGLERIHRFNLRKRPDEPKGINEFILRKKEGYNVIWDSGNLKFILENNKKYPLR